MKKVDCQSAASQADYYYALSKGCNGASDDFSSIPEKIVILELRYCTRHRYVALLVNVWQKERSLCIKAHLALTRWIMQKLPKTPT